MTERAYTFSEIQSMRQAIEWSYPCGVAFYPEQRTKEIEERVRTLMVGGCDPKEVIASCMSQVAQQQQMEQNYREQLAKQESK